MQLGFDIQLQHGIMELQKFIWRHHEFYLQNCMHQTNTAVELLMYMTYTCLAVSQWNGNTESRKSPAMYFFSLTSIEESSIHYLDYSATPFIRLQMSSSCYYVYKILLRGWDQ